MEKLELTAKQKKTDVDLYLIVIVTFLTLGIFMGFQTQFIAFVKNDKIHILIRTVVMAFILFGVSGLGITIVSILEKVGFFSYGLKRKGIMMSIVFSTLMFVPNAIFCFATGVATGYLPFQAVWMTKDIYQVLFL